MSKGKIYFLVYKEKVVYIGKSSRSVESRVKDHIKTGKMFDSYKILDTTTLSDMHWLEVYLITKYKPFYNKDCKELDEVSIDLGINLSKLKVHKVTNSNNSSNKVYKFLRDCEYIATKEPTPKEMAVTRTMLNKVKSILETNKQYSMGEFRDWIYDNYNKVNGLLPADALFCSNRFLKDNFVDFTEALFIIEKTGRSKFITGLLQEGDNDE